MKTNLSKTTLLICTFSTLTGLNATAQDTDSPTKAENNRQQGVACDDSCRAQNSTTEMTCKLTSPELRKRKETVIASLKQKMIYKRELTNGYAFKFPGTDNALDELAEFIKTERECCDFFIFGLSISGDKSEAWLELTGAEGVKDFITAELGL